MLKTRDGQDLQIIKLSQHLSGPLPIVAYLVCGIEKLAHALNTPLSHSLYLFIRCVWNWEACTCPQHPSGPLPVLVYPVCVGLEGLDMPQKLIELTCPCPKAATFGF